MRRWRFIALIIGVIGMVSWGFAQEIVPETTPETTDAGEAVPTDTPLPTATSRLATPTRTPTPQIDGAILYGESEILFPMAIRFFLRVDVPLVDLASVTLSIQPEEGAAVEITADLQADVLISEPDTDIEILWPIPEDNPPHLFTVIAYEWQVELKSGETARFIDQVYFLDQRVRWTRVEDPALTLALPLRNREALPLAAVLNPIYDLLASSTGRQPSYRLLLYDDITPPGCSLDEETEAPVVVGRGGEVSLPCDPDRAEAIYRASGYTVLEFPTGTSLEAFLIDYLVRDFYAPLWDERDVPPWFAAGLSQFYMPARQRDLFTPAQVAARSTGVLPLAAMNADPRDANADLWQAQSYGMVLYMAEMAGADALFELAATLVEDERFDAAYQRVIGQPLTNLIPAWTGWLLSRDAARAYTLNLYGPATATLTSTASLTPSRTPTPSDTPSPTVTPSVTGFLSPTSPPSVTPSQTFTPAAPTVTPRRAGSLPTLTPTPAPTLTETLAEPGIQGGVLIALAVVLAVLVFVFIRLGRR